MVAFTPRRIPSRGWPKKTDVLGEVKVHVVFYKIVTISFVSSEVIVDVVNKVYNHLVKVICAHFPFGKLEGIVEAICIRL